MSSIWTKAKDEFYHYLAGTKLLGKEIGQCRSLLVAKYWRGNAWTRREMLQIARTKKYCLKLIPFSVFIIVPFLELALPVVLKVFPGMLPSTFDSSKRIAAARRSSNRVGDHEF